MNTKPTAPATARITVKVAADLHRAVRHLGIERDAALADLVAEGLKLLLAEARGGRADHTSEPGVAT